MTTLAELKTKIPVGTSLPITVADDATADLVAQRAVWIHAGKVQVGSEPPGTAVPAGIKADIHRIQVGLKAENSDLVSAAIYSLAKKAGFL